MILNLTPHTINCNGREFHPEPVPARVSISSGFLRMEEDIPVFTTFMGPVENLPPPVPEIRYIVSRVVFDAAADRYDLLVPHKLLRDEHGVVVGCEGLCGRA